MSGSEQELNVSEEAIQALRTLSTRADELNTDLQAGAGALIRTFEENESGLGAHSNSIRDLLELLEGDAERGESVTKLAKKCTNSANLRELCRNENHYRSR